MGQETAKTRFTSADESRFLRRVRAETAKLHRWAKEGRMARPTIHMGQEIEYCLIDRNFMPASVNAKYLKLLASELATTELAGFNVEFNTPKAKLGPGGLMQMRSDFVNFMARAFNVAEDLAVHLVMIGILPTISPGDLGTRMLTSSNRYRALIRKFANWEDDAFNTISIVENDGLKLGLNPVACEAVTTSQQVHLQVPEPGSGAFYNAAQILAGPLVALSANSPFFLGRNLWSETRIPVFEQVTRARFIGTDGQLNDIFGTGYLERSVLELFDANLASYTVMLPDVQPGDDRLANLALHNGTIWRWNRPVFAFEDGEPTLRLEVRVMPSGTTNADMVANIAFLVGALRGLVAEVIGDASGADLERRLSFAKVKENFYACARDGLDASVSWFGNRRLPVRKVLLDKLVPLARRELKRCKLTAAEIAYLQIAAERIESGINGASYQRMFAKKHGLGSASIRRLTGNYWRHQLQGMPVHKWTL